MSSPQEYKAKYPHCDHRVLHSPGICVYCDKYPEEQEERKRDNIPFTDELTLDTPLLPGEDRARRSAEKWPGNGPKLYW